MRSAFRRSGASQDASRPRLAPAMSRFQPTPRRRPGIPAPPAGPSMFKGVLLGFACYAAYAISDAFVKSLHGTLPAYEAVFFGAVLMLSALPFIRKPGDRYVEVFHARKPSL